jgi:hypothetical protein
MCIKDYETDIGGQGPVRAVELLKENLINHYDMKTYGGVNV